MSIVPSGLGGVEENSPADEEIARAAHARLGLVLRDKYRLDRVLGIGGMATVYAATHRNGNEFAVKLLHAHFSVRADLRARFLREGHAAAAVKHPGAVTVLDDDLAEDGSAFLVMELLRGESVWTLFERNHYRLPLDVVVGIGVQLLDVLGAAHARGVVHRDIKPANLFLTQEGQIKVLDFGLARLRDMTGSHATQTGVTLGTPAFMAPEQAMAKMSEIDARADVWATGATVFTLACGKLVHEAENAQLIMIRAATTPASPFASALPSVPPPIGEVVDRALAFEKRQRWSSAKEMGDALRSAATSVFGAVPTLRAFAETMKPTGETAPGQSPAAWDVMTAAGDPSTIVTGSPSRPAPAGPPTAQPVVANAASKRQGPRTSLAMTLTAGGMVLLLAVTVGAVVRFARPSAPAGRAAGTDLAPSSSTPPSTPLLTQQGASAIATAAPVEATPPPASTGGLPVASAVSSVGERHLARVPPSPRPTHSTATPPVLTLSIPSSAVPSSPDCNPPYTFDAQGNRKWKRECIQ